MIRLAHGNSTIVRFSSAFFFPEMGASLMKLCTRTRINTILNDTEANAAGRSVRAGDAQNNKGALKTSLRFRIVPNE